MDRCVLYYDNALQNAGHNEDGELEQLRDSVETMSASRKYLASFCDVSARFCGLRCATVLEMLSDRVVL